MDKLITHLPQLIIGSLVLIVAWVICIFSIFIWRLICRKVFKKGLSPNLTLSDAIAMRTIPFVIYYIVFLLALPVFFGVLNFDILKPVEHYLLKFVASPPSTHLIAVMGVGGLHVLNQKRILNSNI